MAGRRVRRPQLAEGRYQQLGPLLPKLVAIERDALLSPYGLRSVDEACNDARPALELLREEVAVVRFAISRISRS